MVKQARSGPSRVQAPEERLRAQEILVALRQLRRGEFDARLPDAYGGVDAQICDAFNDVAELVETLAEDLADLRAAIRAGKARRRLAGGGLRGGWRRCVTAVNAVLDEFTEHTSAVARVVAAAAAGDFTQRVEEDAGGGPLRGEFLRHARAVNGLVAQLSAIGAEVTRVASEVAVEGRLGAQARVRGVRGAWKEFADAVNLLAGSLTSQVRDLAQVTMAVARGDLSRKVTVNVRGELLAVKGTINAMVDQLSIFSAEVIRVGREVGVEGVLGGQIEVRGVSGIWKDMVDNVNFLGRSLMTQVRAVARVVTAVARGDLSKRLDVGARGEIATLFHTIDDMTGTLSIFAAQVSGVARAVGVEGRLGGQADVPGAAGVWRDLTNNVNELAGNLTRQVRAIGDVVTAVTCGDLTRSIDVEARGEVAALKDSVNHMIRTLAATTRVNQEQDWLKTNLTRFTRMLQGQRDLLTVARDVLFEIAPVVGAQRGVFYLMAQGERGEPALRLVAAYASHRREEVAREVLLGEGLVGQAAAQRRRILVTDVPADYVPVESGLGRARPLTVVVVPVLFEGEVKGVVELASFRPFSDVQLAFLEQFFESLGIVITSIDAQERTDELLRRSQGLARELQDQQEQLRRTNEELERRARQLWAQKSEVERKNQEVELARQELEEKAEQLTVASKYKSQFLANMSHELRTPLNSLLILSRQLAENRQGNLDERQVQWARTIHHSGADLLEMINEILDKAKIEAGMMQIEVGEVGFAELRDYVERTFSHVADEKRLAFAVAHDDGLPPSIVTDDLRLKQILRNLLSNAFKFTERGGVQLAVYPVRDAPSLGPGGPDEPDAGWIAFAVTDTGIGIAQDQHKLIFEAFQQADGTATRKYGGTGLGLAISRELAGLLGGDVHVESRPGQGSTFTLYLPRVCKPRSRSAILGDRSEPSPSPVRAPHAEAAAAPAARPADAREEARPGERVLLIFTGDAAFARTLTELGRQRGLHGVVAADGARAIEHVQKAGPAAIALEIELPDVDGWVLLDRLKHDPRTRHVPALVLSAHDEGRRALAGGALGFVRRPAGEDALRGALGEIEAFLDRGVRRLLVADGDEAQRAAIRTLVGEDGLTCTSLARGDAALAALEGERQDCAIVGLDLADMSGLDLLEAIEQRPDLRRTPILVHVRRELSPAEEARLGRLTGALHLRDVRSQERLLAACTLHLHRSHEALPPGSREQLLRSLMHAPALAGRKVLVVDDDARNTFTLTTVLEHHGAQVVFAENGREALVRLGEHGDVDVVLMDVMMPEVDGYEATRRIRARGGPGQLPIIAVTAKAMKGDREKCLRAGASDYITKPVDPDQLVSMLRVWLCR